MGAPPRGCSLLPSMLASELGTAPAGTRVAACPHQSPHGGFCLGDTAAPWWSCLDFSALYAPLLCQLLPKLPRHVLLTALTCLSTLLAMLLVTSTPSLPLYGWGPGHHCSWPCQVLTADVSCVSLWVPHEAFPNLEALWALHWSALLQNELAPEPLTSAIRAMY